MSNKKLRLHNTDISNLISNLRGEVGEIISTWVMMRGLIGQATPLRTNDLLKDSENRLLVMLDALIDKLNDEIVARLAELAEPKVGRLTFHFAQLKLQGLETEINEFAHFIQKNRFEEKRNHDISHKELPEKWTDHKVIYIPYRTVLEAISLALQLMKKIDDIYLGPRAKYLWREMHRRRYKFTNPASIGYMLLPYYWLSSEDRKAIIKEEMADRRNIWKDMPIKINGKERIIKTYGEFGALILGRRIVLLDQPFIELTSIDFPPKDEEKSARQVDSSE